MGSNIYFPMRSGKVYSAGRDLLTGLKRLTGSNLSILRGQFGMKAALSNIALSLVLAALYFFAGIAGSSIKSFGSEMPVWLATGIGFAAVLFWGTRSWVGIFIGTLVVNLSFKHGGANGTLVVAFNLAVANTAEAIIGGELIRTLAAGREAMAKPNTVFRFLFIAAGAAALPASLGALLLVKSGAAFWPDATSAWLFWWLGGCGSAVTITPLLLVWSKKPPVRVGTRRLAEATGLLAILAVSELFLFFAKLYTIETSLLTLAVLILLLWIAFRFPLNGATVAMAVTAALAVTAGIVNTQLLAPGRPQNNATLIFWEAFLAVAGTSSLVLGAETGQRRRMESALRSSEDRYRELFQKIPEPMWVFDVDTQQFLAVNEAAIQHYGYSEAEFLNMRISDIRPTSDEPLQVEVASSNPQPSSKSVEARHRKKDGTVFPVEVSWHYLDFEDIRAGIVLSIDLTQRKQADRRAAAFSNLGRRLSAARTHLETARIVMETADELTGWDAFTFDLYAAEQNLVEPILYIDTIEGKRVDVTAEIGVQAPGPHTRNAIEHNGQLIFRKEGDRPSGQPFGDRTRSSASLLYVPIRNDKSVIGVLSIQSYRPEAYSRDDLETLQDLADQCGGALDRLRAESEILRLNSELEVRVKQRTAQLEATNRELEAFSYSVSHDLRAPLRSIRGFGEVLLERYSDNLDERGREFLRRSCESSRHMDNLIEDLLKLSRVGRSQMQVSAVDLSMLAETIAADLQKAEPERHVKFIAAPGMHARGDERLLRVALNNLLGNAWKFTSKNPAARVEFGETTTEPPAYYIRDNGAGFDMNYAAKLFGVFQRLHNTSEFPGTGVGLATVQRIINRHGGTAWAEGTINKGATFYFTLSKNGDSNQ
jgi:PAS domain S-box-containing protein